MKRKELSNTSLLEDCTIISNNNLQFRKNLINFAANRRIYCYKKLLSDLKLGIKFPVSIVELSTESNTKQYFHRMNIAVVDSANQLYLFTITDFINLIYYYEQDSTFAMSILYSSTLTPSKIVFFKKGKEFLVGTLNDDKLTIESNVFQLSFSVDNNTDKIASLFDLCNFVLLEYEEKRTVSIKLFHDLFVNAYSYTDGRFLELNVSPGNYEIILKDNCIVSLSISWNNGKQVYVSHSKMEISELELIFKRFSLV